MINLLSDAKKDEIRAGRANVIILNYLVLTIAGAGLLVLVLGVAYVTLNLTRTNAQTRVDESTQASAAFNETQQAAQEFRNNLATAKQIIDKEVTYSALVLKIAKAIPSGVYLENLSLSAETVGAPTSLMARARTVERAVALKSSLEDHPELFSNIYFETLVPGGGIATGDNSPSQAYPVQVGLNVTINKEALQ